MSLQGRLEERERPHRYEHERSIAQRMAPPKDLLGWLVREFRAEMPEDVHDRELWREYVTDDHRHAGGGSLLGTPRYADRFRRFIEDSPFAVEVAEYEGHKDRATHYRFPLRAALATLAGRGKPTDDYQFMARTLYRIAVMDGDVNAACASMGILGPVRRPYLQAALHRLWSRYSIEPPARSVRTETAA